jgi:hypothetical protein
MIRVISPDEYDDAARLNPALCPLVVAGDTRCGRRLLLEADADAARGLAAALETIGGGGGGWGCGAVVNAALAVAQRLRRLATVPAAAASSAWPGSGLGWTTEGDALRPAGVLACWCECVPVLV